MQGTREPGLYILDCLFSVLVIGSLVVFVWRGLLNYSHDKFNYKMKYFNRTLGATRSKALSRGPENFRMGIVGEFPSTCFRHTSINC